MPLCEDYLSLDLVEISRRNWYQIFFFLRQRNQNIREFVQRYYSILYEIGRIIKNHRVLPVELQLWNLARSENLQYK